MSLAIFPSSAVGLQALQLRCMVLVDRRFHKLFICSVPVHLLKLSFDLPDMAYGLQSLSYRQALLSNTNLLRN